MIKKTFYNIIKILITIGSLLFIYKSSKGYFQIIFDKINLDFYLITCLIFLRFFQQIIASLRLFSLIKLISKYNSNFIEWSRIYFSTALVYLTPIIGAGHLMRSYEMKNRKFSYKEYINLQFIIFSWGMLIESSLMLLIFFFIEEIHIYVIALFFLMLICFLPAVSKNIINLLYTNIKKIKAFNFLNKFKFFNAFKLNVEKIILITISTINGKNFLVYFFYTTCLFCLEFLLFYLLLTNIFMIVDFKIVILFFILNFLIRKIPLINNITGFKEVFVGIFMQQFGLIFLEGVLFSITFRVLNLLALLLSNLFFFLIKKKINFISKIN